MSPEIVVEVALALFTVSQVQVAQAGDGVTVYFVMGEPLADGSVQPTVTVSFAFPAALTRVGAFGALGTVVSADGSEGSLVPCALVAVTVKT